MSNAFLQRVSIVMDDEDQIPPIIETVVHWEVPYKEEPIEIVARDLLPKGVEGPMIFDMLHLHIRSAVTSIGNKYDITVSDPILSIKEMEMLRTQYENGMSA